ncbi:hypothetical protein N9L22_01580, partial [Candidatus Poseidonia alphae]|nr:hypothetical protein [Candidatus Poseidonia alphae]
MWEHRSVSDKTFKLTQRILPSETYVKLMDEVEAVVADAEKHKFDDATFMTYIPRKGPWEEIPASDHSRADARTRYIGPASAKLLNTNIVLGSSWIDSDRFKFERRIENISDYLKQKTVINANMWTPKQLFTTQTFFFCSTGDEERMGGAILEGDTLNENHLLLGAKDGKDFAEWEVILWGLGHRGVVPDSDPLDRVYYPSLMHRNVSFNNRVGWIR